MTVVDYTQVKRCNKCKAEKLLGEFNKNKAKPDGLGTECRKCANAHSKSYHIQNHAAHLERCRTAYLVDPDSFKARAKQWHVENNARVKELAAIYRDKNREKIKEISRIDWSKHNEKRNERKREYRQERPDLALVHVRIRQTRKQNAMPKWADVDAIKKFYTLSRELTKATGIKHHVDHFYPLKNDYVCGLHNEFNLRVIPAFENQAKGNRFIDA